LILVVGDQFLQLMPFFVVIAKFGVAGAFNLVYISNADVFPTLFCATAMGICNFFARVVTIMAPEVAEQPAPLPMGIFVTLCSIAAFLTQFIRPLSEQ
jgi:hypothetical protein